MAQKYRDTDYLHLSVALRVKETKLLTPEFYDKLLDAKNAEEALRLLTDAGFPLPEDVRSAADFEKVLTADLTASYREVSRSAAGCAAINPQLLRIFRLPYDYMNLKALIKAELLNISPEGMLFETGTVPSSDLADAVRGKTPAASVDASLLETLAEARTAFAAENDPREIDLVCDRAYFVRLRQEAADSGLKFLETYALLRTDIMNLTSALRIRMTGKSYDFFAGRVAAEGTIPLSFFERNKEKSPKELVILASSYPRFGALASAFAEEDFSFSRFEHLTDDLTGEYIRELRRVPFGAELVASYLLSKEAELKNVRIVMAGKLASLPAKTVRERLRFGYV